MPKIKSRVTFNKAAAVMRIKAANDRALTYMGKQALKDANIFVPRDQGPLENSSYTNSDFKAENGTFRLRWTEPYSRYLWFGLIMHGTPANRSYGPENDPSEQIKYTQESARKEWAKHAKEVYGDDWKQAYQNALRKELRNG